MKYSEAINFRAGRDTADWLRDEAERRGESLSEVIRSALSQGRPSDTQED